jgi:rRNA-processing protein FCF1
LGSEGRLLVVDANVLIDYATADATILRLATRFVGMIHVPRLILEEVKQLGETDCERLGLRIVEASFQQLAEARQGSRGLSFNDRVCLILARDSGWICVTNDRALRKACEGISVSVLWGLELMLDLVAGGHLAPEVALQAAQAIQLANPRHITDEIRFKRKVDSTKPPKPAAR